MSKDFSLRLTEQDGRFDVQIWKLDGQSGSNPGWWIRPAPDHRAEVVAEIFDIVSAADAKPNFDMAKRVVDERFRKLCEKLGCPLDP